MTEQSIFNIKNVSKKNIEENYRRALQQNIPELILLYGIQLIKEGNVKDLSYMYAIYECMLKSSIELNLTEYSNTYFNILLRKFGSFNGKRINLLKALVYEAKNKNVEALNIYKKCLEKYPCDIYIRSKIINLKRILEKNTNKVIILLNDHLKEFPLDFESWHELGEIYIKFGFHSYALFCFEEILLHQPQNLYFILTCAELYYTLNQHELSSKYFSLSITINNENLRGLWGIVLVNIMRYANKNSKSLQDNVDILLTKKCLHKLYQLYEHSSVTLLYKESILQYLLQLKDYFN